METILRLLVLCFILATNFMKGNTFSPFCGRYIAIMVHVFIRPSTIISLQFSLQPLMTATCYFDRSFIVGIDILLERNQLHVWWLVYIIAIWLENIFFVRFLCNCLLQTNYTLILKQNIHIGMQYPGTRFQTEELSTSCFTTLFIFWSYCYLGVELRIVYRALLRFSIFKMETSLSKKQRGVKDIK